MTSRQATAEVFLTAFKALPRKEQNAFLFTIIQDRSIREDIIDFVLAIKRCAEKTKSFRSLLKNLNKK